MTYKPFGKFRDGLADWLRPRHPACLAALVVLLMLPALLGERAVHALRYERGAIASGEVWRWLSGHWVHHNGTHLLMNLAGLVLLWGLYVRDAALWAWCAVVCAAACAVSGGLWLLDPEVLWYLGLSGVLHGIWAAAAVFAWRRWPTEAVVTATLLAVKLGVEHARGPWVGVALDHSLPVIVDAHLFGALGGGLTALALVTARSRYTLKT